MSKLRGEDVIIGLGMENPDARGTRVAPQIWLPGRSPSGITPVLEKTLVRETRGTKIATHASEIEQKRVEGDIEVNVRVESIGFLLRSLLGKCVSNEESGETGVYEHVFSVLPQDPQHPSQTIAISQPNVQDYDMPLGMVSSLEITAAADDLLMAKVSFIAKTETEQNTPYEPTFDEKDYYFRQYEVSVKLADAVAGLGAATAQPIKEFSLAIPNNARPDYNIGNLTPSDVIALLIEPTGSFMSDVENTDLHDIFLAGTYKAMEVTIKRADIIIGTGSNPTITILMPKVSFETWAPDRPIDDIVTQNVDYQVHYDETEQKAIEITVINERADYLADGES